MLVPSGEKTAETSSPGLLVSRRARPPSIPTSQRSPSDVKAIVSPCSEGERYHPRLFDWAQPRNAAKNRTASARSIFHRIPRAITCRSVSGPRAGALCQQQKSVRMFVSPKHASWFGLDSEESKNEGSTKRKIRRVPRGIGNKPGKCFTHPGLAARGRRGDLVRPQLNGSKRRGGRRCYRSLSAALSAGPRRYGGSVARRAKATGSAAGGTQTN